MSRRKRVPKAPVTKAEHEARNARYELKRQVDACRSNMVAWDEWRQATIKTRRPFECLFGPCSERPVENTYLCATHHLVMKANEP